MYTLFAAPGACSRVPMIALEEAGAVFEVRLVRFMKGQHKSPDYLKMNPAGKVPVLVAPDGPLAENVAIARYLASRHKGLLPDTVNAYAEARITSDLSFCSANLHPIVTRMRMPMFMADGEEAVASVRAKAIDALMPLASMVESRIGNGPWWFETGWSILDAYIYWVWFRSTGCGFPGGEFPDWRAHAERMEARPSVQRALEREAELQSILEAEGLAPPMR